jgi:hypothetical protein
MRYVGEGWGNNNIEKVDTNNYPTIFTARSLRCTLLCHRSENSVGQGRILVQPLTDVPDDAPEMEDGQPRFRIVLSAATDLVE